MTSGLRRFARPAPAAGAASPGNTGAPDRCELCGEALAERHSHMVDLEQRVLACGCRACALLFTRPGGRYRTVPDRVRHDPDAPLTAADWAALRIPVSLAFFMPNSALGRVVASYPSAAGATECELDLAEWNRLAETRPLLRAAEPDVESILITADGDAVEAFLVPVDVCYELAGGLRMHWHGFDGGAEARQLLTGFLNGIRERSRALEERDRAGTKTRSGE